MMAKDDKDGNGLRWRKALVNMECYRKIELTLSSYAMQYVTILF